MSLHIRPYTALDAEPTLDVFLNAIRVTAAQHYSAKQIDGWADTDIDPVEWGRRRESRKTEVATLGSRVVGFTDIDDTGYVDMMFVHPDAGRRGVASALLTWALGEARLGGAATATTHASITARPFFEFHGFVVTEEQRPVYNGVAMTIYAMELRFAP